MNNQAQKDIFSGTAVCLQAKGAPPSAVLLRGLSGSGKSDLALRLMNMGGTLISDDQVSLERYRDHILASPVDSIQGLLEVRGVGLAKYPTTSRIQLRLIVDLTARENVPRLPEWKTTDIFGVPVTRLQLHAFDASTPAKITTAIGLVHNPDLLVR